MKKHLYYNIFNKKFGLYTKKELRKILLIGMMKAKKTIEIPQFTDYFFTLIPNKPIQNNKFL